MPGERPERRQQQERSAHSTESLGETQRQIEEHRTATDAARVFCQRNIDEKSVNNGKASDAIRNYRKAIDRETTFLQNLLLKILTLDDRQRTAHIRRLRALQTLASEEGTLHETVNYFLPAKGIPEFPFGFFLGTGDELKTFPVLQRLVNDKMHTLIEEALSHVQHVEDRKWVFSLCIQYLNKQEPQKILRLKQQLGPVLQGFFQSHVRQWEQLKKNGTMDECQDFFEKMFALCFYQIYGDLQEENTRKMQKIEEEFRTIRSPQFPEYIRTKVEQLDQEGEGEGFYNPFSPLKNIDTLLPLNKNLRKEADKPQLVMSMMRRGERGKPPEQQQWHIQAVGMGIEEECTYLVFRKDDPSKRIVVEETELVRRLREDEKGRCTFDVLVERAEKQAKWENKTQNRLDRYDLPRDVPILYVRIVSPKEDEGTVGGAYMATAIKASALEKRYGNLWTTPALFSNDPLHDLEGIVREHVAINPRTCFVLEFVTHGAPTGLDFKTPLTTSNIVVLTKKFPKAHFVLPTLACFGGGLERQLLSLPPQKNIDVFLQTEGALANSSATLRKTGDRPGATSYEYRFIYDLFQTQKPFGRIHKDTDNTVKRSNYLNPRAIIGGKLIGGTPDTEITRGQV